MINKQKLPLIIGLAIPVLMILFVAGAVYVPRFFLHPQYDFVYVNGDYYYRQYSVENGKLIRQVLPEDPKLYYPKPTQPEKFFVYDIQTDTSKEISFSDAQKLVLDSNLKSPDGYEVKQG